MSLDPTLYTRDWHLQDLALERLELGDLEPHEERGVRDHLVSCPACEGRRQAIAAELAVSLPELTLEAARAPTLSGGEVVPLRHSRMVLVGLSAALAMAAGMVVVLLQPSAPQDGPEFTRRGSELSFEVYRKDDKGAVRVQDGDGVRSGDRLGFRVASHGSGHLVVLGIDGAQTPYPCYPADPTQSPVAWAASPSPVQLDAAVELDATPGQERIVALLCDNPVGFDALAPQLRTAAMVAEPWGELPDLHPGCLQRELRLHKLEGSP